MIPCRENEPGWDDDIKNDVLEEVSKLGSVVHIHVDSTDPEVRRRRNTCGGKRKHNITYLKCFSSDIGQMIKN